MYRIQTFSQGIEQDRLCSCYCMIDFTCIPALPNFSANNRQISAENLSLLLEPCSFAILPEFHKAEFHKVFWVGDGSMDREAYPWNPESLDYMSWSSCFQKALPSHSGPVWVDHLHPPSSFEVCCPCNKATSEWIELQCRRFQEHQISILLLWSVNTASKDLQREIDAALYELEMKNTGECKSGEMFFAYLYVLASRSKLAGSGRGCRQRNLTIVNFR